MKEVVYRVSGSSNVKSVAGIVAHTLKGDGCAPSNVVLTCCGASAISQAVKAIAVARGFLAVNGRDLITRIGFDTVMIEEEEKTIIKFFVSLV